MATRSLAPLPSNMTRHTRVLFRYDDAEVHNQAVSAALSAQPIEDAQPMRSFYAWKGKRNLEGLHFLCPASSSWQD
ncbi:hypothetical protein, partial [Micrococcus sp. HMSC067E09]|uniref:hypothetical protein n=1 Tax=Micrococcus sp. HMSC067E09 TaxID=1739367 RepID=UPI001AEF8A86